jgi:hypothetical protein
MMFCYSRDSSEEEFQGPQTSVRNRKHKQGFMKEKSSYKHPEDVELGLPASDVNRECSDSEFPHGYQYDADDEGDAVETLMVTQPPLRNVEPAHTEVFYETE